jgi:hypothetical protein
VQLASSEVYINKEHGKLCRIERKEPLIGFHGRIDLFRQLTSPPPIPLICGPTFAALDEDSGDEAPPLPAVKSYQGEACP